MEATPPRVQIHQYNDSEILEFFIKNGVEYRLVGDHLFIIRSGNSELAAGPGDWLVAGLGGEVQVERGDYALRAQRAISRAKALRRERGKVVAQVQ
jgi:RNA-splicing ligase RtcB